MTDDITAIVPEVVPTTGLAVSELADAVTKNIEAARSANTRRGYQGDWHRFESWCAAHGVAAMPADPATVAAYATALGEDGKKVATIERALTSIAQAHGLAGKPSPTTDERVRTVLKGIRRRLGRAQRKAQPLLPLDLRVVVKELPTDLRGLRDRALLLVGFSGAFRRSELVAIEVADVEHVDDGLVVTVRRGKTDQEGQGRRVGIPHGRHASTCPVKALAAWLEAAGTKDGPIFREVTRGGVVTEGRASDRAVDRAVKRAVKAAGLDASGYSAHSLRAGFVTAAVRAGKREDRIMAQTGHRSHAVMAGYIREAGMFVDNAAVGLGL